MAKLPLPACPFSDKDIEAIIQNLLKNIATSDNPITLFANNQTMTAMPGAIIASPALPDNAFTQSYFFHWVRDGAIVMSSICTLYKNCNDAEKKATYLEVMLNYVNFVEKIQSQSELNGIPILGEPKFNIDGSLWTGAWGRPQIGGAACQAAALTKIALILHEEGKHEEVVAKIYNPNFTSLLKANLEYCAKTSAADSFNVWEELNGNHFSVRSVQRTALYAGAFLAFKFGDFGAAQYYNETANHLTDVLHTHWNENLGYYFETLNEENLLGGGIDTSILITLIHAQALQRDDEFSLTSSRVLSTIFYIRNSFESLYHINVENKIKGKEDNLLIGRYPQDIYDGNHSDYGNPWILCSNTLATSYYAIALALLNGKKIIVDFFSTPFLSQLSTTINFKLNDVIDLNYQYFNDVMASLIQKGDAILEEVKKYSATYDNGTVLHMSEQIDRTSGKPASARDLSWNYASLLEAVYTRKKVISMK